MAGWKASNVEDKVQEEKKKDLKDAKIKCRICTGDHWTLKCPFKDSMAPAGDSAPAEVDDVVDTAGSLGQGNSSYVPPHMRKGGAATGERMGGRFERDDLATLRVTNVSPGVQITLESITNDYHRSASLLKSRTSETCSVASAMSLESFWRETERRTGRRDLRLSALLTGRMLRRRVIRWMALVSRTSFCVWNLQRSRLESQIVWE